MSINLPDSTWRLVTPGGIAHRVVERSGVFEEEGASATEVYIIEARNLNSFVLESFPLPTPQGGSVFYPERRRFPGLRTMVTRRVAWEAWTSGKPVDPFGIDTGATSGTYGGHLKLTIDYSTNPANDAEANPSEPKTYLEIVGAGSADFESAPVEGKATWDSDGKDVDSRSTPQLFPAPTVEWTVRWSQIPWTFFTNTLLGRMRGKLGKINSGTMTLLDAPAETIMFMGWQFRQQFTWRSGLTGQSPVQVEMKFLEKNFTAGDGTSVTHQHSFRPGVGWDKLKFNGSDFAYTTDDLDAIITG